MVYVTEFGKKEMLHKSGKVSIGANTLERNYITVQKLSNCCSQQPFGQRLDDGIDEKG